MISDSIREEILAKVDILNIAQKYLPELKRHGANYTCCCPIHGERTPSFTVHPARNYFKCYGCGKGGNAITFLMDVAGKTYVEAIKELAASCHINLPADSERQSPEEHAKSLHRADLRNAMQMAQQFYVSNLIADNEQSRTALNYARSRWDEATIECEGIGFAPGGNALLKWIKSNDHNIELFEEIGLLATSEKGELYDAFRNRLMIPIWDRTNHVISYTARDITGASKAKYVNTSTTELYNKSESIYGIHHAVREARIKGVVYLVEGAPDVLRLASLNVTNAIAPLGTAWTKEHYSTIKNLGCRVCFIPDIDEVKNGELFGTGIRKAIENGARAVEEGFDVSVKEIPISTDHENGQKLVKQDPDTFFTSKAIFDAIPEQDFIPWMAAKKLQGIETTSSKSVLVAECAQLVACIVDPTRRRMMAQATAKALSFPTSMFTKEVNEARRDVSQKVKSVSQRKTIDQEEYAKYGFYEENNCYYSLGSDGESKAWSNFKLIPLFHIKDPIPSATKRIYTITNYRNQSFTIELKQEDLISLAKFRLAVESLGDFRWDAKEEQLQKLKAFLYANTDSAEEIKQLGWQKKGFWMFGNGAFNKGEWVPADNMGIVRLGDGSNYYVPAASDMYKNDSMMFDFEKRFIYQELSTLSLNDFCKGFIKFFGDNAIVGLGFYFATLFRDIIYHQNNNFPLLNLFGKNGTGKSSFAFALMSFFSIDEKPVNLSQITDAGLADVIGQRANALVFLDEYKNDFERERREAIKRMYDGNGRKRMNMDRDKKTETSRVDSAAILAGQDMPTADAAIFSRVIHLHFDRYIFDSETKANFDKFNESWRRGMTHITLQILKLREMFQATFAGHYQAALSDAIEKTKEHSIQDRILRNWVVPLAAYRTLSISIETPFDYHQMLDVCAEGAIYQNKMRNDTDELGGFWRTVDFLHQDGQIFQGSDYRIKLVKSVKLDRESEPLEWLEYKKILFMSPTRIFKLYKKNGRIAGETTYPEESLKQYLKHSAGYLGTGAAMRFDLMSNPTESVGQVTSSDGRRVAKKATRVDKPMMFDYDQICQTYSISLETEIGGAFNDEEE